ncbi:MAG: GNAT family N-acetyltransferase [Gemmatimonadota bacterium]
MTDPALAVPPVPGELRTARLLLRPWHRDDAERLLPVLESNRAHLGPWIPRRVSEPAPIPELAERLAGFAAEFAASREWRYAMFALEDDRVLGEIALFPRSTTGRVALASADRAEIGYWLREDATGTGLATEAAWAMLALARALPAFGHVEIRCDARNAASAAIPIRLGFTLAATEDATGVGMEELVALQVWTLGLARAHESTG